jgi:fido (protein-threonine AMPylation protein)
MAPTPPGQRHLAEGLRLLQLRQQAGGVVFRTADFSRVHRDALVRSGFLRRVTRGWYRPARPGDAPGDTTPWYAAMAQFIAGYANERFGTDWHLDPASSLRLHAGATVLPLQLIVHSPRGTNNVLALPDGCSLLDYKARDFPAPDQIEVRAGLRVLTVPAALIRVSPTFFATAPLDAQVALAGLPDASDLTRALLAGGHSAVAGRLAGALRAVGRAALADDVIGTFRTVGYSVSETNPFETTLPSLGGLRTVSPYVRRLQLLWTRMRDAVIATMPPAPGRPADVARYLNAVAEAYTADAYHSLSIEGYRVTDGLIARVATGDWNPAAHVADADARNAMAAHGYWRAHAAVQGSVQRVLEGAEAGAVARDEHGRWYRDLFGPSVDAGVITPSDLAGYRNEQVFIRNAAHVPPPWDAVRDLMPALFHLLTEEPDAGVRAVLGHFAFVYVHPYMDGNGRMGRFLMNVMLASGGYPWTIIRVERRSEYMAALDAASAREDIAPFARFIASCVEECGEKS